MARKNGNRSKNRRNRRSSTTQTESKEESYFEFSNILQRLSAKTEGQEIYLESITDNTITICDGPAGSGKSFLAFGMALKYYLGDSNISKIVIVRPTFPSSSEPELGFLPGTLSEKMGPFLAPLLKDSANKLIKKPKIVDSLNNGVSMIDVVLSRFNIEIVPLQFMRGRSFSNSFIVVDEVQNINLADFKLLLTRIGENCKVVMQGDSTQKDRNDGALRVVMDKLEGMNSVGIVNLYEEDIVRSELVKEVLRRL